MFISTYREQTHRIDKAGYGSEIWLRGVVLLVSEPSARTGLTPWCKCYVVGSVYYFSTDGPGRPQSVEGRGKVK